MSLGHVHSQKSVVAAKLQVTSCGTVTTTNRDGRRSNQILPHLLFLLCPLVLLRIPPHLSALSLPLRPLTFLLLLHLPYTSVIVIRLSIPTPSPAMSHVMIAWSHLLYSNIWMHNPSHDVHKHRHQRLLARRLALFHIVNALRT